MEKYQDLHSEKNVSKLALEQEITDLKRRLAELTQSQSEGSEEESESEDEPSDSRSKKLTD